MTPRSASCWGATPHGAGTSEMLRRRPCGGVAVSSLWLPAFAAGRCAASWGWPGVAHTRSLVSAPFAQGLPPAPAVMPVQSAPVCLPPSVEAVHRSLPIRHDFPRHLNGPAMQGTSDLVRGQMSNHDPVRHLGTPLSAVSRPQLLDHHCDPSFPQCRARLSPLWRLGVPSAATQAPARYSLLSREAHERACTLRRPSDRQHVLAVPLCFSATHQPPP